VAPAPRRRSTAEFRIPATAKNYDLVSYLFNRGFKEIQQISISCKYIQSVVPPIQYISVVPTREVVVISNVTAFIVPGSSKLAYSV